MIRRLLKAGKPTLLAAIAALVLLTAFADWWLGHHVSLGVLYILPMMLGALVLSPAGMAVLAVICSILRLCFDVPAPPAELTLRALFAVLAYFVSGLFVTELVRNRKLAVQHLESIQVEQALRLEAEEQLRVLAESSPAAILTVDGDGTVLAANRAASGLFAIPPDSTLTGRSIGKYLPVLGEALHPDVSSVALRTAAQCQGYREDGEVFLANMWFSSYSTPQGSRLAAIVVDSSEEMRDREEEGLRQLLTGNTIAAAAVAHEVRNVCGAIRLVAGNLSQRYKLPEDPDFRALAKLIEGLESIASIELQSRAQMAVERMPLREVLENLRIVIEPEWREIDGTVRWSMPAQMPFVLADAHGLMQAFLNVVQNSHRAVQKAPVRELSVTVSVQQQKATVRFQDSGPGIAAPEKLFQPFQDGAAGTGLGLYVSRSIVRGFGGELRFEPQAEGSCFAVELQVG